MHIARRENAFPFTRDLRQFGEWRVLHTVCAHSRKKKESNGMRIGCLLVGLKMCGNVEFQIGRHWWQRAAQLH